MSTIKYEYPEMRRKYTLQQQTITVKKNYSKHILALTWLVSVIITVFMYLRGTGKI